MKISYLFPSRSRPLQFIHRVIEIITLSESDNFEIIGVLDLDDETMTNPIVKGFIDGLAHTSICWGYSQNKIHACNRGIVSIDSESQIIVLMSDDMRILKQGFDNDIRDAFKDGFNGLVHFPDGIQNENMCTFPIISIDYLLKSRHIYHPDYISLYADKEQTEVARLLDQYKYIDKKIIEHLHYRGGKGVPDALMLHNDSHAMYSKDQATFNRRKSINFEL